jgi:hypothetical protein
MVDDLYLTPSCSNLSEIQLVAILSFDRLDLSISMDFMITHTNTHTHTQGKHGSAHGHSSKKDYEPW